MKYNTPNEEDFANSNTLLRFVAAQVRAISPSTTFCYGVPPSNNQPTNDEPASDSMEPVMGAFVATSQGTTSYIWLDPQRGTIHWDDPSDD